MAEIIERRPTFMSRVLGIVKSLPQVLAGQISGVALLTLLPFMFSGIIFEPFFPSAVAALAERTPAVYVPAAAVVLVLLCIVTLVASRDHRFAMCLLSAILLAVMAFNYAPPFDLMKRGQLHWPTLWTLYSFTGFLTFVVIVLKPTLSSVLFRTIVILLGVDMVAWLTFGTTFLHPLFLGYFPSHLSILFCLMVIMFLRTIFKFIQENGASFKVVLEKDRDYLKRVKKRTLKLWWPMPVLFVLLTALYSYIGDTYVERPLIGYLDSYEGRQGLDGAGYDSCRMVTLETGPPIMENPDDCTVEAAAKALIDRLQDRNVASVRAQIDAQVDAAGGNREQIVAAVKAQLPKRFPGTETERCFFLNVVCHIKNGIKSMINGAYRSARNGMISDLENELARAEKRGENSAEDYKRIYTEKMDGFSGRVKQAIGYTATGIRFSGFVALLYGLLILAKSYMIVFARVFYARVTTSPAQDVIGGSETARKGAPKACGPRHTLRATAKTERFYVAFRACGNNVVDRRRLPQPLSLLVKRLFSKNYAMCLVELEKRAETKDDVSVSSCDLIVDPPAEIVEWKLAPDEEILVDFANVVAFSDTCKLGRRISLSLGALVFGRAIYHSVQGPGRVFIKTASAALAGSDPGTENVMQASSLIAWKLNTEFHVVASLTTNDIFLSGYSIRKADPKAKTVVYDTSQSRRVGTGQGILRLTRAFLLPF
ncbi:AIM24 family protein [Litoreibacter halocynthiae]|uniref:AIM24 family protein n=1 Tax=Litoreibacter halocynthiae TaxID=1242689 RepID=UPI0024913D12|nr:AIM24 family protein [Litoreibacter halocynthiae]